MLQHFLLTLECGGVYEVSAQKECAACSRPFEHDYAGKEMPVRCCAGSHKVVKQEPIEKLMGATGHPPKETNEHDHLNEPGDSGGPGSRRD